MVWTYIYAVKGMNANGVTFLETSLVKTIDELAHHPSGRLVRQMNGGVCWIDEYRSVDIVSVRIPEREGHYVFVGYREVRAWWERHLGMSVAVARQDDRTCNLSTTVEMQ